MIATESRDGVAIVRLARREHANALVPELLDALVAELQRLADGREPVVLAADGATFCPGADLRWLAACPDPVVGVADLVAVHHIAIRTLLQMPVPVVAAIDGAVAGGGLGLALAADYRVAGPRASFTAAYFRLGLPPDGGASVFLPRTIGVARTLELLLTNRRLDSAAALDAGLVNEVVTGDAIERAVEAARAFLPVPGYTLLQTRRLLDAAGIAHQLQLEAVAIRTAARHPGFKTALAAFAAEHAD